MNADVLVLTALLLAVAAAGRRRYGTAWCTCMAVIGFSALLPRRLTDNSVTLVHGVTESGLEVSTYGVVVAVAGLLALLRHGGRLLPSSSFLLAGVVVVGFASGAWDGSERQWAGVLQYALAPLGWVAGSTFALLLRRRGAEAAAARAVLLMVACQAAISLLQWSGWSVFDDTNRSQHLASWRVSGTLGHPNQLGLSVFLLQVLLLPSTRSPDRSARRAATAGVLLAFLPLVLSGGRTVLAAGVLLLLVWSLLSRPGTGTTSRARWAVLALVAALVAVPQALERFSEGSGWGARGGLNAGALESIRTHAWLGVGPNSSVVELGRVDPVTAATHLPVHNAFLLSAVELGVIGAVLLLWPAARALGGAMSPRRRRTSSSPRHAVALASAAPGLVLVALTDWSLLADSFLPLSAFVIATSATSAQEPDGGDALQGATTLSGSGLNRSESATR